jgi:hypothetical protein
MTGRSTMPVTRTASCFETPSDVTVTVAAPLPAAITRPDVDTVTTPASDDEYDARPVKSSDLSSAAGPEPSAVTSSWACSKFLFRVISDGVTRKSSAIAQRVSRIDRRENVIRNGEAGRPYCLTDEGHAGEPITRASSKCDRGGKPGRILPSIAIAASCQSLARSGASIKTRLLCLRIGDDARHIIER